MIPDTAVPMIARNAAFLVLASRFPNSDLVYSVEFSQALKAALEAAAPHMLADADLMRWKLDALKEWSDAMINESNSPQYGRDVRTLLEVGSMDEAREIDAL